MAPETRPEPFDRRRFLVAGGVTASLAAILVACATEDEAIPVSGEVAQPARLTQPPVNDAVYLRTSSSIVHNAIDSYVALLDLGVLSPEDEDLISFVHDQHVEHAALLEAATVAVGGEAYAEPNEAITETVVVPSLDAINGGGDDPLDVLRYANAFDTLIGTTLQGFSPNVIDRAARQLMVGIIGSDNRHSAVVASRIDGFTTVGAETAAQAEASSGSAPLDTGPGATANTAPDTGPVAEPPLPVSQVPNAFASLAAVEVVLGGVALTWQTPVRTPTSTRSPPPPLRRMEVTMSGPGGRGPARPGRGKSGLHRAWCWREPGRGDLTDSVTESRPPMGRRATGSHRQG